MSWWDPTFKKDARTSIKQREPYPWQRKPAERGRRAAETFAETIPTDGDNDGYGIRHGPFGTFRTGGMELRAHREKHPAVFQAISEALARQWTRGMMLEAKKGRKR